jgi:hypothetical protein
MVASILPVSGEAFPTAVTGVVRDSGGTPQMGAMVQLMAANSTIVAEAYTNLHGGFVFEHVLPGTYQLKATGTSFLPTLRENLRIRANSKTVVNLTLNTLFEAIQWLPAAPRSPDEPSDDWKWTLRSSSNRPLLRFFEDGPLVVVTGENSQSAPQLEARVSVTGSSRDFAQSGPHNAFEIERSSADGGHLILRANLGPQFPDGSDYMAGYQQQLGPDREIRTAVALEQTPQIQTGDGPQSFQTIVFRSAESVNLGPNLTAQAGDQIQSVEGAGELVSSSPFADLAWHSGGSSVTYSAATTPGLQNAEQIADSNTLAPSFSEVNGALRVEHGLHQEIRVEDEGASLRMLVAFYHDRIDNPIVEGGGALSPQDFASGDVLYDPLSQVIRTAGPGYSTAGFRLGLAHRIGGSTWASVSYADGRALVSPVPNSKLTVSQALYALNARRSQAVATALSGTLVSTGTHWRASYRWQPADAVSSVDLFDNSDQGAYLSILIRQPISGGHLLPNGTEALIAVRNLLAEGYRPFLTPDGSTLYFAQADRCVQAGLSFSF